MAMAAVDKVFRMNPDPRAGEKDRVSIDKKINEFLKAHFVQFEKYYNHPIESSGTIRSIPISRKRAV
jgi:hypothetical protein